MTLQDFICHNHENKNSVKLKLQHAKHQSSIHDCNSKKVQIYIDTCQCLPTGNLQVSATMPQNSHNPQHMKNYLSTFLNTKTKVTKQK